MKWDYNRDDTCAVACARRGESIDNLERSLVGMREEFYFTSGCGNIEIRGLAWKPKGEIKAILQISHGMAEHIQRYDEFARYLSAQGYYVVGNDHLGHGKSVFSAEDYGYFYGKQGNDYLIKDMHLLRERFSKEYPSLPYFILGHSMGSTLLRQYISRYGEGLDGVIFSGIVGHESSAMLMIAKSLCRFIGAFRGVHYRSKLLDSLVFGKFDKMTADSSLRGSWVTRDLEELKKYTEDELCGFIFTTNGYYHLFDGLLRLNDKKMTSTFPKNLPILIVSGTKDPVGGFEAGIRKVYESFIEKGATNVTLNLYEGARHEVLNEINREEVYQDIERWMADTIGNR